MAIPVVMVVALAACDDDPFAPVEWTAVPDTVQLYSLSDPQHGTQPSGFDFVNRRRVWVGQVDAVGGWDLALAGQGGGFVLMPSGAFEGAPPGPGITPLEPGISFDAVDRAPGELDEYIRTEPVPLEPGRVYVIRSRATASFIGTCRFYSKLEVVESDAAAGWLRFRYVTNPNCNDRALVPRNS